MDEERETALVKDTLDAQVDKPIEEPQEELLSDEPAESEKPKEKSLDERLAGISFALYALILLNVGMLLFVLYFILSQTYIRPL